MLRGRVRGPPPRHGRRGLIALVALLTIAVLPGSARAGLIDDLAATFGVDVTLVGAGLFIILCVFVILLLAIFDIKSPTVIIVVIVAIAAIGVPFGLLPSWVVILLAVLAAGLLVSGVFGKEGE